MKTRFETHIVRDLDDPDRPSARVETIGDLVFLEVSNRHHVPESILIHPEAARWLAAGLILQAEKAEAFALAAAMGDCEGDAKGGVL